MESKRDGENFNQVDERVSAALEAGYVSRAPEPADVENLARVHVAV
jgi:hypothetical protein